MSDSISFVCEKCHGSVDIGDTSAAEWARCEEDDMICDSCIKDLIRVWRHLVRDQYQFEPEPPEPVGL